MSDTSLPKVAFFSFTSCEGCQLTVLSCEDELADMLHALNIVYFREAMTGKTEDYEIAFVEGSVSTDGEIKKLKHLRKKAKVVVALGACSATGGLNCLKNRFTMDEVERAVYGKNALKYPILKTLTARPIDSVIKVDCYIHGCPIPKKEFLSVLNALRMAKTPEIPNHPVCVDCKKAGNICVFEKGMTCLGPVTRAGCDAICVTYGCVCWGCRGTVDNPNLDSHAETLRRFGLSPDAVLKNFDLYGGYKLMKYQCAKTDKT
ncbi:MAG: NADH:ubiquinone oxidoreductase [Deltaproteobacteria bacterium]|nr:NADH:ubiquinone oxidoreductase [Deltaproteobacteria bacterium]